MNDYELLVSFVNSKSTVRCNCVTNCFECYGRLKAKDGSFLEIEPCSKKVYALLVNKLFKGKLLKKSKNI